jgi:hypothetical protein
MNRACGQMNPSITWQCCQIILISFSCAAVKWYYLLHIVGLHHISPSQLNLPSSNINIICRETDEGRVETLKTPVNHHRTPGPPFCSSSTAVPGLGGRRFSPIVLCI